MSKNQISKLFIFMTILAMSMVFFSCLKLKGFKKDSETGLYYKFYVQNDSTQQVQNADIVWISFVIRDADSVINKGMTGLPMEESIFKGDMINALEMMHKNDSATFVFRADTFYKYYMNNMPYTKKNKYIYFDVKVLDIKSKAEVEAIQRQYRQQMEAMMEQYRLQEDSLIQVCVKMAEITTKPTESGLYKKILKKGTGKTPKNGQQVGVHYTGKLADNTVFDSSVTRDEIFTFTLGNQEVISGWEEAVATMKTGEKAVFVIPSKLAYGAGSQGLPFPPYSPLIFEIELISVQETF